MARRRPRQLIVDQDRYLWSLAHTHEREQDEHGTPRYEHCREVVVIRRDGSRTQLDIVFQAGTDHFVRDGLLHSGAVLRADGSMLNLNEPGVVRALLDEALARGWQPTTTTPSRLEIDGWALFDAVLARRRNSCG
jgi:hypothetical protein